nr:hypothetical protein [Tanacetum cinerariifolium]
EEEEEEHLAPTVPAPAQYSSDSESDETEPFEEGETAATPPPFGYRIAARISVQPHILMPFRTELEKIARFTTPTSRYEIGESSVAAAARQIRPTLTIAESRRADVTQMEALRREKMAPKRSTRLNLGTTPITTPSTTTTSVTNAQLQAMINDGVNAALAACDATRKGDDIHTSGSGARRLVQAARECSYSEFLNCKPLDFK